jgi:hypothetical protein
MTIYYDTGTLIQMKTKLYWFLQQLWYTYIVLFITYSYILLIKLELMAQMYLTL